jgi:hypothetical protein
MNGKGRVHIEGKTTINATLGIIKSKSTDQTRFSTQLHKNYTELVKHLHTM